MVKMTLIQGDCLKVLPTLEDKSVDLVLTDPPYFLPVNSYVGTREKGYERRTLADTSILKGYFERVFQELDRILTKDGTFYIFCDAQSYPIFYEVLFPFCKNVRLIVWDKIISYNGYTWRHQHELVLWGEREKTNRIPTGDGDIIKCRGVLQKDRFHPAEKPIEILQKLIKKNSPNIVLDCFVGSGSSMVACQKLGINCIGIELDENYVNICKKRLNWNSSLSHNVEFEFKEFV